MEDIAATVVAGLTARHWDTCIIGVDSRSARMTVTHPATGEECELDILKEVFNQPPAVTPYGPVLGLYDVIGTKIRALAGRGLPRDLIDIHAASQLCSNIELESLGRRHAWDEQFRYQAEARHSYDTTWGVMLGGLQLIRYHAFDLEILHPIRGTSGWCGSSPVSGTSADGCHDDMGSLLVRSRIQLSRVPLFGACPDQLEMYLDLWASARSSSARADGDGGDQPGASAQALAL